MNENLSCIRKEDHKIERLNYKKANYKAMRHNFTYMDWSAFEEASTVNEKWDSFLKIYNDGVRQYVPRVNRMEIARSGNSGLIGTVCRQKVQGTEYGINGVKK